MEQPQHELSPQAPRDLLSLLRGVESTPRGDLEWARHCTRQQAIILTLTLGQPRLDRLDQIAQATGVRCEVVDQMPLPAMHLPTRDGWCIYVSALLSPSEQLRIALHRLKHVIDHPVRARNGPDGFSDADFDQLATYFAGLVLTGNSVVAAPTHDTRKEEPR